MKTFHLGAVSGLVATLAANDAVFAFRKPTGTTADVYIERIRIRCVMTTPPTTTSDQEFALHVNKVTAMTANFTGGTDLSDSATPATTYAIQCTTLDRLRVRETDQVKTSLLVAGNARIATTGTLTSAGSPVINPHPFLRGHQRFPGATALAAGASCVEFMAEWKPAMARFMSQTPVDGCLPLLDDEGIVVRAPIAIANSLVVRVGVELDWFEQ
jgi:hypothetical protein